MKNKLDHYRTDAKNSIRLINDLLSRGKFNISDEELIQELLNWNPNEDYPRFIKESIENFPTKLSKITDETGWNVRNLLSNLYFESSDETETSYNKNQARLPN